MLLPESLSAVVFDCDGTLVDSEPIHAAAIGVVLTSFGIAMPVDMIVRRFAGYDNDRLLGEVGAEAGVEWPLDMGQRLDDACHRLLLAEVHAMPGAMLALDACRAANLDLAVASNSKQRLVTAMLSRTRLDGYFGDRLATRDRVRAPKPAADAYVLAAAYCAVRPSQCLAVEDSPAGVTAARSAGMTAIGYRPGGSQVAPEALLVAGAETVIEDLHQLAALITGRPLVSEIF